ncbi:MAG: GDSL-type esterase/lipase family protein [Tepidisphaeraceae bacterium]
MFRGAIVGAALAVGVSGSLAEARISAGDKNLGAVWFLGDSITQSNGDGDATSSPRSYTYSLLTDAGYTFTYTGHSTANSEGLPTTGPTGVTNPYRYHSGVAGAIIGDSRTVGSYTYTGLTQNVPTWWSASTSRLATVKPNVIFLLIGGNDINNAYDVATAPDRMKTLIDTIYAQPGVGDPTIFVATLAPNRTSTGAANRTTAFNAALPGVVKQFTDAGKDVVLVDHYTPLNASYATAMTSDNLHPNGVGNQIIANTWVTAINTRVVPEPTCLAMLAMTSGLLLRRRRTT